MKKLNLGILAHVDAGKTSLTERLLYNAGVIEEIGRVDDGSTQTDSLALERQRGITIRSAVVSFVSDDVIVNLIDTPGHPDFIAEVERVLSVLDGAVLVISAVEGVQAQTRVLMRTLRRLRIPTLIFVNKVDRRGARGEEVLAEIADKLVPAVVPMGSVEALGTRSAGFAPCSPADPVHRGRLVEVLAEHDETLLATYVEHEDRLSPARLRAGLVAQTGQALVHPAYFGSAMTGAGVTALMAGITGLLPAAGGNAGAPVSGTVFKIERGPAGEKIAYLRMFSGTLRTRARVRFGADGEGKVTAIRVFDRGSTTQRGAVVAGEIGLVWGLGDVRIGDDIGTSSASPSPHHFAPPSLETVVVPGRREDRGPLHLALTRLAEQDPLINVRQDDVRQEISVSLYGEVQKEVIEATLAGDFGLRVGFRETTTICIERPLATGEAVEVMHDDPNPFLATVGLRIDPRPPGTGVTYGLEVELGSMPLAFLRAIEDTVRATLQQGLFGWQVTDCHVALTRSGYAPRQSHAHATFDKSMSSTGGDFRNLTPLVVMAALRQCGTEAYEPMHRFTLDIPADTFGPLMPLLAALAAVPHAPTVRGSSCTVVGDIPAAHVHELQQRLPGLTRGEDALQSAFHHYQPVRGPKPTRPRVGADPLDRKEYLLRVGRRVPQLG